jgi:hypothetical protein
MELLAAMALVTTCEYPQQTLSNSITDLAAAISPDQDQTE